MTTMPKGNPTTPESRILPVSAGVSGQPDGLVLVKAVDDLEAVEEQILQTRLTGQEHVESYLYCIISEDKRKKPVVGPTSDFVQQLVRRMNSGSKGKINLQLIADSLVVTDFATPDERGILKSRIRVIVSSIDKVTGEVRHGIKEVARAGIDPGNVAYTKAVRRAFEIHPSYNRKTVARFIKGKLRELGYDPKQFVIVGERGGGEWDQFFAMAKAKGVDPQQLRAGVRDRTGKGLSEASTSQDVDAAAHAIHETLKVDPPTAVSDPGPGGDQVDTSPPGESHLTPGNPEIERGGLVDSSAIPSNGVSPIPSVTEAIDNLRAGCQDIITNVGFPLEQVDRLWKRVRPTGGQSNPDVIRERYRRFFQVLYALSIGEKEAAAVKAALEDSEPAMSVAASK